MCRLQLLELPWRSKWAQQRPVALEKDHKDQERSSYHLVGRQGWLWRCVQCGQLEQRNRSRKTGHHASSTGSDFYSNPNVFGFILVARECCKRPRDKNNTPRPKLTQDSAPPGCQPTQTELSTRDVCGTFQLSVWTTAKRNRCCVTSVTFRFRPMEKSIRESGPGP